VCSSDLTTIWNTRSKIILFSILFVIAVLYVSDPVSSTAIKNIQGLPVIPVNDTGNISLANNNISIEDGPIFLGQGKSINEISKTPSFSKELKLVPEPKENPLVEEEREKKNIIPPADRSKFLSFQNLSSRSSLVAPAIDAAQIGTHFDGLSGFESNGFAPPDVQMAAGPNHILEMVNVAGNVWTKQGNLVKSFDLQEFFGVDDVTTLYDPRIIYDPQRSVWYIVMDDHNCRIQGALSPCVHLLIIPSSDPTNTRPLRYNLPYSSCPDFPLIGFSNNVVAVSANLFSSSKSDSCELANPPQGAQYYLLNKNDLINGVNSFRFYLSNPDLNSGIIYPTSSLSPTDTTYMTSLVPSNIAGHSDQIKLISFALDSSAAKVVGSASDDIGNDKSNSVTAAIPQGAVVDEWVDPLYGKNNLHKFLRGVTLYCTDTDHNCVNNINKVGETLDGVGLFATPCQLYENCNNGYTDPYVQNCLANPNTTPNCYWGEIPISAYRNSEGIIEAKLTFPKEPSDIGESFIRIVLHYDGSTLTGNAAYNTCSKDVCLGDGSGTQQLSFVKKQSASEVSVTTKVINDDGGNAKPTDFNVFLNNLVCQQGTTNCHPPIEKDQFQPVLGTGVTKFFLTYDASNSPTFQTTEYSVNLEAKRNPLNCHGEDGNTQCQSFNGFNGYDISFLGDCSVNNAETDKKYSCLITIDDKPPIIKENFIPIGEATTPPSASQPNGEGFETSDARVLSSALYNGKIWLGFDDRCFFTGKPDRACIRLDQIDITSNSPTLLQDFQVGQSDLDYFFPALSIDNTGNMIFVFGISTDRDANNNPIYPSLLISGQGLNNPDTIDLASLLIAGNTPSDTTDPSHPRNRYGDYFAASIDPIDKSKIWVAGQYHTLPDGADWSTHIGQTTRIAGQSPQQILIKSVNNLHTNNVIKAVLVTELKGLGQSNVPSLSNIKNLPNTQVDCAHLKAFLNTADAFKRTGKIPSTEVALTKQQTQAIENKIGCRVT